ncbi:NAD(P)-binding protein [Rhizodiscina lignyota]|uniref:NAD(P)-binding protein n=1 Tax=Rhizodiscina lignyota TaxID=1504668 RepID=A0A9P4M6J7_9PEZI|nr:NAD(P)-binding protein [Rhizodiscina lignyota]
MAAKFDPIIVPNPVLPKGSWILVTGVSGYIGSHVADQLLAAGYKVRGITRNAEKSKFLFDLICAVADMAVEGVFDGPVKGVAGVVHLASQVDLNPDPNVVVNGAINQAVSLLNSAIKTSSVKRYVLTSSSMAPFKATVHTYNEDAVKEAWEPPPYTADRAFAVYSASKTQQEQNMWEVYKKHKTQRPNLVANSVVPDLNGGLCLDVQHQGFPSSLGIYKILYDGDLQLFNAIQGPKYYVDVQDTARLHVAALLLEDVVEERIFAFAFPKNCNDDLATFRKVRPDRKFPENDENAAKHLAEVPRARTEDMLRRLGRKGWTSMEESFANMVAAFEQGEQGR